MSKLKEWVNKQIEGIDKDERFHYKPANVQINAPLTESLFQKKIECGEVEIPTSSVKR